MRFPYVFEFGAWIFHGKFDNYNYCFLCIQFEILIVINDIDALNDYMKIETVSARLMLCINTKPVCLNGLTLVLAEACLIGGYVELRDFFCFFGQQKNNWSCIGFWSIWF